ncbi:hypothetical protein HRJ34_15385 [Rhizorhabdus wittichii]|uniref:Uncharacterized protein n=1 Tax=Rhizorhabdus wittichii TaxID=160791 RepID=A0A975D118_9SPHN|nr:hypothetical protein [Rhizorhabdus wittichii]QTH19750.1 hypothetical protein HRJ34_15385 [Rhizorhabdus wittichii]
MIRDIEQAHAALADAIWWLKGFAAARPASIDEGAGEHRQMEARLQDVRNWLHSLTTGSFRRLGDEKAIVMTYAEFERFVDAARPAATWDDLKLASDTAKTILDAYRDEATRSRGLEIPF